MPLHSKVGKDKGRKKDYLLHPISFILFIHRLYEIILLQHHFHLQMFSVQTFLARWKRFPRKLNVKAAWLIGFVLYKFTF